MNSYCLSHLSDRTLLRDLVAMVARERAATADLLAHIAEVDARRLYLPAGFPSMYVYCVHELGLSEDAAYKRIQAARVARQFPVLFAALADGRLHLSGVVMLAPHLTPENADALLASAAGKSKAEIEQLLAERFPRSETMALVEALPASPAQAGEPRAPGHVAGRERLGAVADQLAPGQVAPRSKLAPVAPERFLLQVTIGRDTQQKLRYAQALLGHRVPSGDIAAVLGRALGALIGQLEKQKFAATPQPRPRPGRVPRGRHIPADVKRTVWERDEGRCTFVGDTGQRCPAHSRLEFDHADPVARGGEATAENLRLRCRGHNQYAAEQAFGSGFMDRKREEARDAAREARRRAAAEEVIPWLRQLGLRADESRRAAALCESIPDASLEERVRFALSHTMPPHRRVGTSPVMAS